MKSSRNSLSSRFHRSFILIAIFTIPFGASSQVSRGRIDLSKEDFVQNVELTGDWEFYWNKLIKPGGFDRRFADYYQFPALWNDGFSVTDSLSNIGCATYRLLLDIPDHTEDYALYLEDYYCSYRLYVDGEPVASNGQVALRKEDYRAEWRPQVVDLPQKEKTLELVLQIANYDHSKGGARQTIRFGLKDKIYTQFRSLWNQAAVLTVFLILLAVFFLVRFGFISLDMASFYFSLFCIVYSYRIAGADLYILHSLLPDFPWNVGVTLEYCTLFISPFLFAKYIEAMYPDETHSWVINSLGIIGAVFTIVTIVTTPLFFTTLIEPFLIILLGYFFYGLTVFLAAFLKKRDGSLYGILSVAVAFGVFSHLVFVYLGWLPRLTYLSFVGYIVFLILQSLQLYTYSRKNQLFRDLV